MTFSLLTRTLASFMICFTLSSCAKEKIKRGYNFNEVGGLKSVESDIKAGITDELSVLQILGSPTIHSHIKNTNRFIYLEEEFNRITFLSPKLTKRELLEITFDDNHIVSTISSSQLILENTQNISNTHNINDSNANINLNTKKKRKEKHEEKEKMKAELKLARANAIKEIPYLDHSTKFTGNRMKLLEQFKHNVGRFKNK